MPSGIYKRTKKIVWSEESKKKQSVRLRGNIPWNKGKKGFVVSSETREKISKKMKGKPSNNPIKPGKEHPNWKGGISRNTHSLTRPEYKKWREGCFKRDNYTCRLKSDTCSKKLQVHHILRWADYPELRYLINNGITLCTVHHPIKKEEEKRMIPIFQEIILLEDAEIKLSI